MSDSGSGLKIIGISFVNEPTTRPRQRALTSPRTPLEQELVAIWQAVLNNPNIGIDDHFIEIGGDSMRATQVISRVEQTCNLRLSLYDLYESPTIRGMAQLIQQTQQRTRPALPPLERAARTDHIPLSLSQERMWFIHHLASDSTAYHVQTTVRLHGALDADALRAGFDALVERHESFRTNFPERDGEPVQQIHPHTPFDLPIHDLTQLPADARFSAAMQQVRHIATRPFDLAADPLLRVHLFKLADDDYILLIVMHHIISDAWSLGVMMRELVETFTAYTEHRPPILPDLPIQFADYAMWQRSWLRGDSLEQQLAYWRRQLANAPLLELPTDHPRPPLQTYHGATATTALDPALYDRLLPIAQQANATVAITFLTAFFVLLHRYTAQNDLVVGMPIANRHHGATEGLVGALVNTLALRAHLDDDPTFAELLLRVRTTALEAYAHQDMPFAKLVAELNPPRTLQQAPLVQVMFNLINVPMPTIGMGNLQTDLIEWDQGAAQFDLTLTVADIPMFKRLTVEFNRALFEPATMNRFLAHYENLLHSIAAHPDVPISQLAMLSDAERQQMLVDWNATAQPVPDAPLHAWFEQHAAHAPDAIALIHGQRTLSFGELNTRANQLAHYLIKQGITPETPVPILMARSFEMFIAQLAVLKAGGAYVPLDPEYPQDRIQFILNDTRAPLVLTTMDLQPGLGNARTLTVDNLADTLAQENPNQQTTEPPNHQTTLDDPAYIIYTSGSTGTPKGVVGLHRGIVNVCSWMTREFPFRAHDVCCAKTPPAFVDALWETYSALLNGVPLVILDTATVRDPGAFVDALAQYKVTRVVLVPSLLRVLLETQPDLDQRLPHLDTWIAGGEALNSKLVRAFHQILPNRTLLNFYGATEGSANSTWYDTRVPFTHDAVPIGKPVDNTQAFILDAHHSPVPIGVTGELYIGGAGLARGYWQQPELSREKFIPTDTLPALISNLQSPVSTTPVLYRTGDLAMYLPDGNIQYRGRADSQIKIRGMRVELGEIEKRARELGAPNHNGVKPSSPQVSECVVIPYADETSGTRLIAYVTPQSADTAALRAHLQTTLPHHMVPSAFVALEKLPLNPSGKIDRRALQVVPPPTIHTNRAVTAPRDELEHTLVRMWQGALQTAPVGIHDDFFELGGHSLLAVRVFAEIQQTLGQTLPIATLFRAPTIAALAQELRNTGVRAPWSPLVPIQIHGTRLPFFSVHGLGGGVIGYVPLSRHLGNDQPFYALQSFGIEPDQTPDATIEQMAARYITAMREIQPHGPYQLGGYSYGGTVALEIAQQLHAQGETIGLLAMFDQPAPTSDYWRIRPTPQFLKGFVQNLPQWWRDYTNLEAREKQGRWRRQLTSLLGAARRDQNEVTPLDLRQFVDNLDAVPPERLDLMRAQFTAFQKFKPKFYDGRVTVFSTSRHPLWSSYDPALGWRSLAREVEIHPVAGAHRNLLEEPHVRVLAAELAHALGFKPPTTNPRQASQPLS